MLIRKAAALFAFPLVFALAGCGQGAPPPPPPPADVGVVTLKPEAITLTTELPGRVVAYEASEVRPQVNGIVRQRYFTEGSHVDRGQPHRPTSTPARMPVAICT